MRNLSTSLFKLSAVPRTDFTPPLPPRANLFKVLLGLIDQHNPPHTDTLCKIYPAQGGCLEHFIKDLIRLGQDPTPQCANYRELCFLIFKNNFDLLCREIAQNPLPTLTLLSKQHERGTPIEDNVFASFNDHQSRQFWDILLPTYQSQPQCSLLHFHCPIIFSHCLSFRPMARALHSHPNGDATIAKLCRVLTDTAEPLAQRIQSGTTLFNYISTFEHIDEDPHPPAPLPADQLARISATLTEFFSAPLPPKISFESASDKHALLHRQVVEIMYNLSVISPDIQFQCYPAFLGYAVAIDSYRTITLTPVAEDFNTVLTHIMCSLPRSKDNFSEAYHPFISKVAGFLSYVLTLPNEGKASLNISVGTGAHFILTACNRTPLPAELAPVSGALVKFCQTVLPGGSCARNTFTHASRGPIFFILAALDPRLFLNLAPKMLGQLVDQKMDQDIPNFFRAHRNAYLTDTQGAGSTPKRYLDRITRLFETTTDDNPDLKTTILTTLSAMISHDSALIPYVINTPFLTRLITQWPPELPPALAVARLQFLIPLIHHLNSLETREDILLPLWAALPNLLASPEPDCIALAMATIHKSVHFHEQSTTLTEPNHVASSLANSPHLGTILAHIFEGIQQRRITPHSINAIHTLTWACTLTNDPAYRGVIPEVPRDIVLHVVSTPILDQKGNHDKSWAILFSIFFSRLSLVEKQHLSRLVLAPFFTKACEAITSGNLICLAPLAEFSTEAFKELLRSEAGHDFSNALTVQFASSPDPAVKTLSINLFLSGFDQIPMTQLPALVSADHPFWPAFFNRFLSPSITPIDRHNCSHFLQLLTELDVEILPDVIQSPPARDLFENLNTQLMDASTPPDLKESLVHMLTPLIRAPFLPSSSEIPAIIEVVLGLPLESRERILPTLLENPIFRDFILHRSVKEQVVFTLRLSEELPDSTLFSPGFSHLVNQVPGNLSRDVHTWKPEEKAKALQLMVTFLPILTPEQTEGNFRTIDTLVKRCKDQITGNDALKSKLEAYNLFKSHYFASKYIDLFQTFLPLLEKKDGVLIARHVQDPSWVASLPHLHPKTLPEVHHSSVTETIQRLYHLLFDTISNPDPSVIRRLSQEEMISLKIVGLKTLYALRPLLEAYFKETFDAEFKHYVAKHRIQFMALEAGVKNYDPGDIFTRLGYVATNLEIKFPEVSFFS